MSISNIRNIKKPEDLRQYLKDNDNILKYIENGKDVGDAKSGDYGKVWLIGESHVLKVTTDEVEMELAEELNKKKTKGFLRIIECTTLPKFQIRIQERCYPITDRKQFLKLPEALKETFENVDKNYDEFKKEIAKEIKSKSTIGNIVSGSSIDDIKDTFDFLERINHDYEKFNIKSVDEFLEIDLNEGNIMKRKDGTIVAIDF